MNLPETLERIRKRAQAISAQAVHAGDAPDLSTLALDPPIVMASAFAFRSAEHAAAVFRGDADGYIYGRWGNPTVEALEHKLAALEGAEAACAVASGMAALSGAILSTVSAGDHIVAPRAMYAESARLLRERLPRFGIETTFVDATNPRAYVEALRPTTKLLYIETPANPTLALTPLGAVVDVARSHGIATLVDNTFATPFCQSPLAFGATFSVSSLTKALGGHGDAIGGAVCGAGAAVARVRDFMVKGIGAALPPHSAYLIARGVRTLPLRQAEACIAAAELAHRLEPHPRVARVHHPSLPSHPQAALAREQMHAPGSMLSFEVKPSGTRSALDAGRHVLEAVRVFSHAVSLGDVRSLIVHPASTTHSTMPADARRAAGLADGLLRVSVGVEGTESLWADLENALGHA